MTIRERGEEGVTQPDENDAERTSSEYDRLRELLHAHISELADEHELPFGTLSLVLIDLGVSSHMFNYLVSVQQPSASGLKMELDRLGREIEHFLHGSKQDADDFVRNSKELIQEAQRPAEGEDEDEDRTTPGKP